MNDTQDLKFDEALIRLEGIIRRLESGSLPLEEAIDCYKEAITLSETCHLKLQSIEKEVVSLVDAAGQQTAFVEGEN